MLYELHLCLVKYHFELVKKKVKAFNICTLVIKIHNINLSLYLTGVDRLFYHKDQF